MGCFLACFGGAKNRKQRKRPKKSLPDNRVSQNYQALLTSQSPQNPVAKVNDDVLVAELRENKENQEWGSFNSCRKKVTFDLDVKTYGSFKDPSEDVEVKELKEEVNEETEAKVTPVSKYRYQNCESSDDECIGDEVEEELDDGGFEEDDEIDAMATEEESYNSFFSLPMDKEKQQRNCQEVDSPILLTVLDKGSARDRSQYVHSVLNPVENLSQWNEVKTRTLPLKKPNKDNIMSVTPNTSKSSNKENISSQSEAKVISVDASLSTWLVSSENSPKEEPQRSNSQWSNSSISREDKPILGALTVEDLRHSSVTSSPRKSPSRNPDEIPIMGTVGRYWSRDQNSVVKGSPNTTRLVSLENYPKEEPQRSNTQWSNSSLSQEDKPILGVLTVEDLKHSSVTSSPRKSPSRNPDEIPIMGTVGRYWSRDQNSAVKGSPNTTWLVSSENSPKEEPQRSNPQWSNSSLSQEDKPILGVLTVEDIKHSSVTSSPRKSPSTNPDEILIMGTMGSYQSRGQNSEVKGIPNSTSKYREDKTVNWHSTPFQVRLERALSSGTAEA